MRKEVLFAVIFGIILGGIILFGIYLANNSATNHPGTKDTPTAEVTSTPPTNKKTLEIISPQNHSVLTDKTITLSGKASPGTNLAIITESDDLIIESGPEGTFSAQINLIPGENTLTVTNLLKDTTTEIQTITVIQTSSLPE